MSVGPDENSAGIERDRNVGGLLSRGRDELEVRAAVRRGRYFNGADAPSTPIRTTNSEAFQVPETETFWGGE
jgi:hypothetical protein